MNLVSTPYFARFPRQVERVERDAVPAPARPGVEAHEAERLGRGRVEHLPDVDAHALVDHLELVHERDVHRAEHVLGDLGRFGRRGARDPHDLARSLARRAPRPASPASGSQPPTTFGIVVVVKLEVARIFALGGEREEEVAARDEPGLLEGCLHQLVGRARVGRRFQHDQLARPQRWP